MNTVFDRKKGYYTTVDVEGKTEFTFNVNTSLSGKLSIINTTMNNLVDDENGVMNKSLLDTGGSILSISQFTLYADTLKGRRPSYIDALRGEEATKLYDMFNEKLRNYVSVSTGIFGSDMKVSITNDGPVTIIMER